MANLYIECHNRQESEAVLKLLEEHTDIKWNMGQLPTQYMPDEPQHYLVFIGTKIIWRRIKIDKNIDSYLSNASEVTYQDLYIKYVGRRMLL